MIKKFYIFESIKDDNFDDEITIGDWMRDARKILIKKDDYYELLITLEELSKRSRRGANRLNILEKREENYIVFEYEKRLGTDVLSPYDLETKTYPVKHKAEILFREKIELDAKNLTLRWIEVEEGKNFLKYIRFYYAPDVVNFDKVSSLIMFLEQRYWKGSLQFDGKPRKHPVGRRDFLWHGPNMKTENDPYGEEEFEYDYPYDDEED
jgi:hypothetical protein